MYWGVGEVRRDEVRGGGRRSDRALLSMRRLWVIPQLGWESWEGSEQRRDRT